MGQPFLVTPDADEFIRRALERERLAAIAAQIRKAPDKHPLRHELLATPLLPYQLDGVAFAVGAGRAILADDMGLGKTIQGVGVADILAHEANITKVLVVCPASLKSLWRSEIRRFSRRSSSSTTWLLASPPEDVVASYPSLSLDDIHAAMQYAGELTRERLVPLPDVGT